ncbi:MAG: type secretion system protein [Armatimonadetes bacterium]|nr:type secretion system protein [Armatimonadota bacterium]
MAMAKTRNDREPESRGDARGGWGWGARKAEAGTRANGAGIPAVQVEAVRARLQQLSGGLALTFSAAAGGVEEGEPASPASLSHVVLGLFQGAIRSGASHLHLVPGPQSTRVRLRVGGVLRDWAQLPAGFHEALLEKLGALTGGDTAASLQPGAIRVREGEREWELHLDSAPGLYGDTLVLRISPWELGLFARGLARLGISPEDMEVLERITGRMSGLLLVGGPGRAGTTSTLYTLLHRLNSPERHLVTVEDPVEAPLPGATQIAVRPEQGLTFSAALTAGLREDPDLLMLSGLPDTETLSLALRAARSGPLVLAGFPAVQAAAVPTDLVELGASRHWVAGAFAGAVAQRRVRRLCEACKKPSTPPESLLLRLLPPGSALEPLLPRESRFHSPGGCTQCRNTGYQGRTSLFEVLEGTPSVRSAIARGATPDELEALAVGPGTGLRTLATDGIRKAAAGDTSLEEVAQVLGL